MRACLSELALVVDVMESESDSRSIAFDSSQSIQIVTNRNEESISRTFQIV